MESEAPPPQINADLNRLQEQLHELHQRCAVGAASEQEAGDASSSDADMVIRGR